MSKVLVARPAGPLMLLCLLSLIAAAPRDASAQLFRRCEPCVPCPTAPTTGPAAQPGSAQPGAQQPSGEGTAPQPGSGTQPGTAPQEQAPNAQSPSPEDLFAQSGAGAASGPESVAPSMVGDYLGGFVQFNGGSSPSAKTSSSQLPLPGGAIPRFKMAEDTSPMPTDRVFLDYDYYSAVPINSPPIAINALTTGFEKTFLGGAMSVELRLPMATTLDNDVFLDGSTSTDVGEIGNLGIAVKALLLSSDTYAVSGGLAISVPTAKNTVVSPFQGADSSTEILNHSVHLLPFVGGIWTPTDRFFAIGYMQVDIDTNGDPVNQQVFDQFGGGTQTTNLGTYYEQTMLYLEGSVGYWLRHDDSSRRFVNGIALFCELHLDQSLNTTQLDSLLQGNEITILDLTAGADFHLGACTDLTVGYCVPLGPQREFDNQLRILLNRRF